MTSRGGLAHGVVGDRVVAEADVFGDGAGEEERVLQDDGEVAGGARSRSCSRRSTPSTRIWPAVHVVEAHHQAGEGGFAGAGVADDGDGLAGLDGEGDVFENPLDVGDGGELGGGRRIGDAVDAACLFWRRVSDR